MQLGDERNISERRYVVLRQSAVSDHDVLVSVIIPSYNTEMFVLDAVRSALEQTCASLEIIVVDDGSTDDSVRHILSIVDPRMTCVRQQNHGLAAARNTGILLARGRYIGFLDSDDIWYPSKVERQVSLLESTPAIGLVFCHSAYLEESGKPTGEFLTSSCKYPRAIDLIYRNHVGNGSTPILRMACFETTGLFDERLRSCEDIEMWVRIAALSGFTLALLPEVLTGYRVRKGSLSVTAETMIPAAALAVECFGKTIPELSSRARNRALAQLIRIVSRKAFANGQIELSRTLLLVAWRKSWSLPVYDVKALILLLLHLSGLAFPRWMQVELYQAIRCCARRTFASLGLKTPASTRR